MKKLLFLILLIFPLLGYSQITGGDNIKLSTHYLRIDSLAGSTIRLSIIRENGDVSDTVFSVVPGAIDTTGFYLVNHSNRDTLNAITRAFTVALYNSIIANNGKDTTGVFHVNRDTLNATTSAFTIALLNAIIANTGKDTTGIFHTNRTALNSVSGVNTGDTALHYIYQPLIANLADTSTYISYPDTTSLLAMQWELDGKQAIITNLADTATYWQKLDTLTNPGLATRQDLLLKQNTITNISDTTKYVEKTDSLVFMATRYDLLLKQDVITNLADTSKYMESDATAGYIPKINTDTKTMSNSLLFENATGVGIGTTAPLAKTEIVGALSTTTPQDLLVLTRPYNAGTAYEALASLKVGSAGIAAAGTRLDIALQNASTFSHAVLPNTVVMTLLSNGNVGIGGIPAEKLDVNGDIIGDTIRTDVATSLLTATNYVSRSDSVKAYIDRMDATLDPSVTNEIQALSISNDTIFLTNGGFVKLPAGGADSQTLSIDSTAQRDFTISISGGNSITFRDLSGSIAAGDTTGLFHSNRAILDATTASFTTGQAASLTQFNNDSASYWQKSDTLSNPGLATRHDLSGKLNTSLTNTYLFVGNGSNIATGVSLSGDASISNTGVLSVNKTRLNVRNETGVSIATTKAVYTSGLNNLPLVALADNTVESKHNVIGVTVGAISDQTNGYIATNGQCDAETNAFEVGNELYLSTSGALTATQPTSGIVQHVGIVTVKGNYPTGKILVYSKIEPYIVAPPASTDVIIRMGDNAAANKTSFRDYANNEVASINSDGVIAGNNLSGTNTGDNATNSQYSSLVTNATHTGDVTGATALAIAPDSINDTHIDFGTGTNQVSLYDVPIGSGYFSGAYNIPLIDTCMADTTIAVGNWCVLTSIGMELTDCDDENRVKGLVGIALDTATAGSTGKRFIFQGIYTTSGLTKGATYYISNTAGAMTASPTTTAGDWIRVVGYAKSTTLFFVKPSDSWTKIK